MKARLVFALLLMASAPARASETITYTYDALGRLVQVTRAGTVNNGASATYSYDPANNRTNVTTSAGRRRDGRGQAQGAAQNGQRVAGSGQCVSRPRNRLLSP